MLGLYGFKPWFVRRLRRVEDALVARRVSPDSLSLAAVGVSVLAGAAIAGGGLLHRPYLWLAVPPLVLARLALNALDGRVARRTRRARPFGTAVNEVGDRLSDAATVGATGFVAGPKLGLGALACTFLASLVGVLAVGLTGRRECGGPMGKADRAALLGLGAVAGFVLGSGTPFAVALWAILIGGLTTAALRLRRTHARLAAQHRYVAQVVEFPVAQPDEFDEEMCDALDR